MSINRESVSTNFISPNKKKYTIFEISSFSQIKVQKSSKMRLDFAVNDFVFFHCHFHVRFLKATLSCEYFFLFCGQIQLQVWRKCFSKEKTHCNEKKQVLQFHPSKVFQWPENFISNETSFVMMQDLLWTHQNFSFQNTVSFVGQDDKRIFSTHSKILSFF